jgi:hypothetical protein
MMTFTTQAAEVLGSGLRGHRQLLIVFDAIQKAKT